MPKLPVEMFDEAPKVGGKVTVTGVIKSIDDDGVEISYDEVKIVDKEKMDGEEVSEEMDSEDSQSLDSALAKAFPNTQ